MSANWWFKATLVASLLAGCGTAAEHQDVSFDPAYRSLIGRDARASSDLVLHAVTLDRNYAKRVDLCSVTQQPGFDGPEVLFRRALPAGTTFRILHVRRCTNCLGANRVELLVRSESTSACGPVPVKILHGALGDSVLLVPDTQRRT